MELQPADLGGGLAVGVIKARVAVANAGRRGGRLRLATANRATSKKPAQLGPLDKILLRGSGLTGDTQKEAVAELATNRTALIIGSLAAPLGMLPGIIGMASSGSTIAASMMGAMAFATSAVIAGLSLSLGRRHLSSPLTDDEITNIIVANEGNILRQDFLRLAREIRKQENISPDVEDDLRGALRALGDAVDRLPFSPMKTTEASKLRENAVRIRAQADAETDALTQASLARQADAVERSAEAAERSALITKRTAALHAELAAQIESLRLGLTAFYTGDADVSGLAALSENVRSVAAEAVSVASARAELDTVSTYTPSTTEPQSLTLTAGR